MYWIAIHENVKGAKLRGLKKRLQCSEAEALGILTILWLWARNNADSAGLLANTDEEDISDALATSISSELEPSEVTEALVLEGWIDKVDGQLYIHDWYDWQSQWYDYLAKKEKDAARKRAERTRAKQAASEASKAEPQQQEEKEEEPQTPPEPPKEVKPKKPPRTKYADNVSMYPEERQKLVDQYGEAFVLKLIEELDNYKGSTGKRYKDDYRAILSWVVERCEKKYPMLKFRPVAKTGSANPFAEFIQMRSDE